MPPRSVVLILLHLYGFRLLVLLQERKRKKEKKAFWLERRLYALPYFLLYNIKHIGGGGGGL